ncbi:helix-turn-helix domain-containing protein [Jeotgalibacillus terrae]|uniref:Helix-turn-helix domain-containing protein n=1 Tax=Jeotgalibacillus terrae TaxID=587735 RepID=A0ABW5ZM02_9BACL|nr:helix-turn-helix transcriptional regulator [Jeotgalibacillus terrae]MBM7581081.1 putative transcriptional regulator [Jeotgalibacillus terrae]
MAVQFHLDRVMFERSNMKVPQLHQLSGVNKNTLYGLYKGELKRVDVDVIDRICSALDCQPGDLMTHIKTEEK